MGREEGREKDCTSFISFSSETKNSTEVFILKLHTLDVLQLCKLILWIPRASFKNAWESCVVLHFSHHLVSNMLIRMETIRAKLIYPSVFVVHASPNCWKKKKRQILSQRVKELFLACHKRCEEIHVIWLVSSVTTEVMALRIKLSERVTVSNYKLFQAARAMMLTTV